MDPQQRLVLESGYTACHLAGRRRCMLQTSDAGIFLGMMNADFAGVDIGPVSAYAATGNTISIAAGRLSFALGTQGPCATIDTACSSALVALHAARAAVLTEESKWALALAVNLTLTPRMYNAFRGAGMLSADGRCKTFDQCASPVRMQLRKHLIF